MCTTTIRRNSTKRIAVILNRAILIREFKYDDMGDTIGSVTPARVLGCGRAYEFDRIYSENGVTRLCINRNWSFTAYDSIEAARASLTPEAFAKYFPQEPR